MTSSVPVGPHRASPLVQGASSHQPPGPSVPPCVCGGVSSLVAVSSVPSCLRLQSSSPLLPARLPRGRGARGGLQPGSTSETVAPACRIPVGDEARGPSPSGSRPGCADGRHPSCRSTQPLHSDPDAEAPGGLWHFPARAAHERQLWTDPRRAFGVRGARSAHSRLLGGPQSWLRGTDFQRLSRGQHLSAPRLPLVPVQKRGAHGAFVESLFAVSAQVS